MFHVEQPKLATMLQCSIPFLRETIAPPSRKPVISLDRYAALTSRPDLRATVIVSVIGRLPIGVAGLAILMLGQAASGSFAAGGAAAAIYVVGLACTAPILGRIIDRSGPRWVLIACAVAYPGALCALVVAVEGGAAAVAPSLALAALAGATFPPITACMRTFYRQQLADDALLIAAYSLESVLIETIFILGPMLVAMFVAFLSPAAAVLFAAGCALGGVVLFLRSPAIGNWRIEARQRSTIFGPLTERGFAPLLVVIVCYSVAFGLVEIGVTAHAAEAGSPALAGVLLGVMSAASAAGGLAYGSRIWRGALIRQFAAVLFLMAAGIATLALTRNAWLFAALCALAGIVMAPALTIQAMLVAKTASPEHSTEAFTWSATGLLAGVGAGLAAGGWFVERWASPSTFIAAAAAALAASALTMLLKTR
jgi:MFS family permease